MGKFSDYIPITPVELDTPPPTPAALFADLGVRGEPKDVQRAAVHAWLEENEPVPNLRMALEFRGFIDAEGRPLEGE